RRRDAAVEPRVGRAREHDGGAGADVDAIGAGDDVRRAARDPAHADADEVDLGHRARLEPLAEVVADAGRARPDLGDHPVARAGRARAAQRAAVAALAGEDRPAIAGRAGRSEVAGLELAVAGLAPVARVVVERVVGRLRRRELARVAGPDVAVHRAV